jgi:hypothetical protein
MDDATALQLQATVVALTQTVVDLKQSVELWSGLAERYDQRLNHIIEQNDTIVRWATDDEDAGAWHAALRGISTLLDRTTQIDSRLTLLEAATAATAGGQAAVINALQNQYARDWSIRAGIRAVAGALVLIFAALGVTLFLVWNILSRLQGVPAFSFMWWWVLHALD